MGYVDSKHYKGDDWIGAGGPNPKKTLTVTLAISW